jgi:uncharacterized protein (DUF1015 family)
MATLRAFRALRYTPAAGPLERLLAPPYDVIGSEMREEFAQASGHNIVWLTLPEALPDDRSQFVRYARSAARLEQWRRDGVLAPEGRPSLYRLAQTFEVPNLGATATRTALLALIRVRPYSEGEVLPHEQTFPKHKEDRLRVLESTRAHLESIFGLYEDPDGSLHQQVATAPATRVAEVATAFDGVASRLDRIDEAEAVQGLLRAFSSQRVWIADGHHRYETAATFRASLPPSDEDIPEDYMMMALTSMEDRGLVLLPTHRILKRLEMAPSQIEAAVQDAFECEHVPSSALPGRLRQDGPGTFGIALPGGQGLLARVRDREALTTGKPGGERLKNLDVSILHGAIFADRLALTGTDFFDYTRSDDEAIASVEHGAPAAFLMSPPSVDDMRAVALNGELMPQKSTYYHPKLPSGLAIWSLKDF